MKFIPAPYSKVRTIEQFKKALEVYPKQICNTKEAFEGKVFELYGDGRACSLDEVYTYCHESKITVKVDDGVVILERDGAGDWRVRHDNSQFKGKLK